MIWIVGQLECTRLSTLAISNLVSNIVQAIKIKNGENIYENTNQTRHQQRTAQKGATSKDHGKRRQRKKNTNLQQENAAAGDVQRVVVGDSDRLEYFNQREQSSG